jgi:hypothetical protein
VAEAQEADFAAADVIWEGRPRRVALFVMTLMYGDATGC